MKKLGYIVLSSFLFINNVYAETADKAKYYFKGAVGLNHIYDNKFSNHEFVGKVKLADKFPLLEIGLGINLPCEMRAELVGDYYFVFKTKENSTHVSNNRLEVNSKTKIDSVLLNVYKNIVTYNTVTYYVGGGVGIAQIKETAYANINNRVKLPTEKRKFNKFAYKLTAGAEFPVYNHIKGDISYNYFNLGSNKIKNVGSVKNIGNRNYTIHNVTLGLRFDI
jgi:opacity protein-like surface antigen